MLASYLAKDRHLSAQEAIAHVRSVRPGSVDTVDQEKAVEAYVDTVAADAISGTG